MIISREYIPFSILKKIDDPAFHIFRNAYVSSMGEESADEILDSLIERNQALCNQEMGWCIPDVSTTLRDILELDYDRPLYTETLPYFEIPERARRFPFAEEKKTIFFFHENEEYGCFSQWYHSPFTVEGIRYSTAEQYMMAKKHYFSMTMIFIIRSLRKKIPKNVRNWGSWFITLTAIAGMNVKKKLYIKQIWRSFRRIMISRKYFLEQVRLHLLKQARMTESGALAAVPMIQRQCTQIFGKERIYLAML